MTMVKDGAGAPRTYEGRASYKDSDMANLHYELARERTELQRNAQAMKAKEEELGRRERQAASLREQRIHWERSSAELRGKLARAEAEKSREVTQLQSRLAGLDAQRERERFTYEREAAILLQQAEEAKRHLAMRQEQDKDRDGLVQEVQDLRKELDTARSELQRRLRDQDAELHRQRVEFMARLEETRRNAHLVEMTERGERPGSDYQGANGGSNVRQQRYRETATSMADGSGLQEESQEDSSGGGGLAAAAVTKMRALEEQLLSWQNAGNASASTAAPDGSLLGASSFYAPSPAPQAAPNHSRYHMGPLDRSDALHLGDAVSILHRSEAELRETDGQGSRQAARAREGENEEPNAATASAVRCREAQLLSELQAERATACAARAEAAAAYRSAHAAATSAVASAVGGLSGQPSLLLGEQVERERSITSFLPAQQAGYASSSAPGSWVPPGEAQPPSQFHEKAASAGSLLSQGAVPSSSRYNPKDLALNGDAAGALPSNSRYNPKDVALNNGDIPGSAPLPVGSTATLTTGSPREVHPNAMKRRSRGRPSSVSGSEAMSPSSSRSREVEAKPANPGNAAGSIQAGSIQGSAVLAGAARPPSVGGDFSPRRSTQSQSGSSSPKPGKPHGAGRLPPADLAQSLESMPGETVGGRFSGDSRGGIGAISDFSPAPTSKHHGLHQSLPPQQRPEVEIDEHPDAALQVELEDLQDHTRSASEVREDDGMQEGTGARLQQAWDDSETWRRRTLQLEERLQQILKERADGDVESQNASFLQQPATTASPQAPLQRTRQTPAPLLSPSLREEPSPRRITEDISPRTQRSERSERTTGAEEQPENHQELARRQRRPPQQLELEGDDDGEAWRRRGLILEERLQQTTAERDRMIEATNELRADMRRLAAATTAQAAAMVPLSNRPTTPEPCGAMRMALQNQPAQASLEGSLQISPSGTSVSTPPERSTLPMPASFELYSAAPTPNAPGDVSSRPTPNPPGDISSRATPSLSPSPGGIKASPTAISTRSVSPAPSSLPRGPATVLGPVSPKKGSAAKMEVPWSAPTPPPAPSPLRSTPTSVAATTPFTEKPLPENSPPAEVSEKAGTSPGPSQTGMTPAASPTAAQSGATPAVSPPAAPSPGASPSAASVLTWQAQPSPPAAPSPFLISVTPPAPSPTAASCGGLSPKGAAQSSRSPSGSCRTAATPMGGAMPSPLAPPSEPFAPSPSVASTSAFMSAPAPSPPPAPSPSSAGMPAAPSPSSAGMPAAPSPSASSPMSASPWAPSQAESLTLSYASVAPSPPAAPSPVVLHASPSPPTDPMPSPAGFSVLPSPPAAPSPSWGGSSPAPWTDRHSATSPAEASPSTSIAPSQSPAGTVKGMSRVGLSPPSAPAWSPSIASEVQTDITPPMAPVTPSAAPTPSASSMSPSAAYSSGGGCLASPCSAPPEAASWMLLMTPEASTSTTPNASKASLERSDAASAAGGPSPRSVLFSERAASSAAFVEALSTTTGPDLAFGIMTSPPAAPPETPVGPDAPGRVTDALRELQSRRRGPPSSSADSPARLPMSV